MTTTTDEKTLLKALAANPNDAAGWLVLADCLQESSEHLSKECPRCQGKKAVFVHAAGSGGLWVSCPDCKGSGIVPDTSRGDRAELIRVQVELANLASKPRELFVADGAGKKLEGLGVGLFRKGAGYYSASYTEYGLSIKSFLPNERVDIYAQIAGKKDCIGWMRGMKYVRHIEDSGEIVFRKDGLSIPWIGTEKRKRESALIDAHPEWVPKCAACDERGFFGVGISGEKCTHCSGTGKSPCSWRAGYPSRVLVPTIASVLNYPVYNPGHDTEWRSLVDELTDYARYLHDKFPTLKGVMPQDRQPAQWNRSDGRGERFSWFDERRTSGSPACLPPAVFDSIKCELNESEAYGKRYPTAELANTALSHALKAVLWEKIAEERVKESPRTRA